MTRARALLALLPLALLAGCATPGAGTWTLTPEPPVLEPIRTSALTYALDLPANVTAWEGELSGKPPRRTTLVLAWSGVEGLRARVGPPDAPLRCEAGGQGVAGEGDGYAYTISPSRDGCEVTIVLGARPALASVDWRVEGW